MSRERLRLTSGFFDEPHEVRVAQSVLRGDLPPNEPQPIVLSCRGLVVRVEVHGRSEVVDVCSRLGETTGKHLISCEGRRPIDESQRITAIVRMLDPTAMSRARNRRQLVPEEGPRIALGYVRGSS